jgi:long-chain acyl-CoA synthetase
MGGVFKAWGIGREESWKLHARYPLLGNSSSVSSPRIEIRDRESMIIRDGDKTIAQIFWARVKENKDKPLFIYHERDDFPPFTYRGKIRKRSWETVGERVRNLGMGLMALGARKGEAIAIMSRTRPEWVEADLALLSIGGQTGSIYPNNLPGQAQYILNDLGARFVFLEGRQRRDGILALKEKSPQLERIITIGCSAGDDPLCVSYQDLMALGEQDHAKQVDAFEAAVAAGGLSDIASYIYTSGTTGVPKGAVQSHEALTYTVCSGAAWLPIEPGMIDMSFLPMAHIFEQFAGPFLDIYRGDVTIAFARDIQTIVNDFSFVHPHYTRVPPRLLEKVYSAVWSKVEPLADMTPEGFSEALEVAGRVNIDGALEGKEVDPADRKRLDRYNEENFSEIRRLILGGNLQFMVAGGAPLSREINGFFWRIGVPVYELYGMTETGGATTNLPGHVKLGSVGRVWPGVGWPGGDTQTRLSEQGEILMKGPNVMLRYHNKPEDTAESLKDGWMHSGDVAVQDEEGFFTITDRIKDILITAGGKNVAPQHIESVIKEEPLISQVAVFGDRKKFLTALITLDPDEIEERAKELGLKGAYEELARHSLMRAEVEKIIKKKNAQLARYETIKNFVLLDHDLSIEAGDLTPTMKVKRKEVFKKYGDLMEALYPKE